MTRSTAPPLAVVTNLTRSASRSWYRGSISFSALGRLTQSWSPWNQPAGGDEVVRRCLDVEDALAGGHPLGGAVADHAAAAGRVGVLDDAVHHVRDGLEPAVRMPRRALRLARRVVDLADLIEVHERVEHREVDAREGTADRESLALEATGRRHDRADGPDLGGSLAPRRRGSSVTSSTVMAGMASSEPAVGASLLPAGARVGRQ